MKKASTWAWGLGIVLVNHEKIGLNDADRVLDSYPFELSGE